MLVGRDTSRGLLEEPHAIESLSSLISFFESESRSENMTYLQVYLLLYICNSMYLRGTTVLTPELHFKANTVCV